MHTTMYTEEKKNNKIISCINVKHHTESIGSVSAALEFILKTIKCKENVILFSSAFALNATALMQFEKYLFLYVREK